MDEMRAVLRHREFRLLWLASSASTLGDRIVFIALALYVTAVSYTHLTLPTNSRV